MWGLRVADEILGAVVWMLERDIGIAQAQIPAPFFFCGTLKQRTILILAFWFI